MAKKTKAKAVKSKKPKAKEVVVPEALRIDLACGDNKKLGFVGIDIHKTSQTDIVADLTKPWPLKDNSVDEIFCCHYIEHVVDLGFFWTEAHRVLKVGGVIEIICPYAWNSRSWQDPTHVRGIVEASFYYPCKEFRKGNKIEHYLPDVDFEFPPVINYIGVAPEWMNREESARNFAIKHYLNVVSDIQAFLKKKG